AEALRGRPINNRIHLPLQRVEERGMDTAYDSDNLTPWLVIEPHSLPDRSRRTPKQLLGRTRIQDRHCRSVKAVAGIKRATCDDGNCKRIEELRRYFLNTYPRSVNRIFSTRIDGSGRAGA